MTRESSALACVLIPIYRTSLTHYERVSLARCVSILSAHRLVLIKPESLDVGDLRKTHPALDCESFADDFFTGIAGYNQLMLSDEFYARFARFEYLLIHQLDAFVFQDQLRQWCERGYDYIGAPWIADAVLPSRVELTQLALRRRLYRWLNRQARREPGMHFTQYAYTSGNGGFSLRKVRTMRAVLRRLSAQARSYRCSDVATHHEDLFFCVEANRYWNRVSTPGLREAAHFAWELQPSVAAELTGGNLPFGCHGWDKLHRDQWRSVFERIGLSIDELLEPTADEKHSH